MAVSDQKFQRFPDHILSTLFPSLLYLTLESPFSAVSGVGLEGLTSPDGCLFSSGAVNTTILERSDHCPGLTGLNKSCPLRAAVQCYGVTLLSLL